MQKMCVTILQDLRAASLLHKGPTRAAVHPSKIFYSSHSWRRSRYKNFFFQLKWVPEIREDSPEAPIILVGTKVDLHQNAGDLSDSKRCESNFWTVQCHHHRSHLCRHRQVTKKEAEKVVRELGLVTFLDCSAITQAGLKTVFDEAIIAAIEPLKKSEDDKCSIL